jgi:hypothetical protein
MVVLRGTKPHTGRGDAAAGIWGCVSGKSIAKLALGRQMAVR